MLSKYVLVLLIGRNDAETLRSSSEPEVRWCGEKSPASVFRAAFQKTQAENYTISAGLWQIETKWKKVDQMG